MTGNAPGRSVRLLANRRYLIRVGLALAALGLLALIALNGLQTHTTLGLLTCVVAFVALDRLVDPLLDRLIFREQQAARGARAEEIVGAILNRLPNNRKVLHDVTTNCGNIDHLVTRNDGVMFLIETKSHRGRVTIERGELRLNRRPFEKDILKQTQGNVYWLRDYLKKHFGIEPWIHAAIVFTNARVPRHCELQNVHVINVTYLERWIARQPGANR